MLNTFVLGFYIVCTAGGQCTNGSLLFEDMEACNKANVVLETDVGKLNKLADKNNQFSIVDSQCITYDKPKRPTF